MLLRMLAVVIALPFGYALGVVAAELIAGPGLGQLPAITVPIGILASMVFAVLPGVAIRTRLAVLAAGTVVLVIVMRRL